VWLDIPVASVYVFVLTDDIADLVNIWVSDVVIGCRLLLLLLLIMMTTMMMMVMMCVCHSY